MNNGVVGDIETMQVRHGDVILLKPKNDISDAKILAICDQLKTWMEYRRIKVHVALMPYDCDIIILREDKKP